MTTKATHPTTSSDLHLEAAALAALPTGVLVVAPDLTILYANQAARAVVGDAPDLEWAFRHARILAPFDGWQVELRRILDTGCTSRYACSTTSRQDDAGTSLITLTCAPVTRPTDEQAGQVTISIDDGASWVGLEQRLEVAERLATIGKMAARVAHELNNPLDGILRYINLALRRLGDSPPPKVKSYLDESRTGLIRMVNIIGDLLAFSRTHHKDVERVNVNKLVEQAIAAHTEEADAAGVVIAADYQNQDMPDIGGGRLYQTCCNLIKNAIDAMPGGGRLSVTTGIVAGEVVVRVADTGEGLPEDVEKVFEPFYTTKKYGKGTGLGLAICRDFIRGMNGTIDATNGATGGAVFTVRLPLSIFNDHSLGAAAPTGDTPTT